jgi:hypothetical protein
MVGGYSDPLDYELLTSDEVTEVANFALSEFLLLAAPSSSSGGGALLSDAFSNLVEATIAAVGGGRKDDVVRVGVLEARRQVRRERERETMVGGGHYSHRSCRSFYVPHFDHHVFLILFRRDSFDILYFIVFYFKVVAGLNYRLTLALLVGEDNICIGGIDGATIYKPLPHTGMGLRVTSWGGALGCDDVSALMGVIALPAREEEGIAGKEEEAEDEKKKAAAVEGHMEEEREEVEPDA